MLSYHDGKISKALLDLFPNIGLDESKLQKTKRMCTYFFVLSSY